MNAKATQHGIAVSNRPFNRSFSDELFEECTLQLNIKVDVIGGDTTSSQKD
jgi:hypothetical protein